ncbi:MAG: hypothetical protein ABI729_08450, partial [Chitinophagales bacterium]
FSLAKKRLRNINAWDDYAAIPLGTTILTDHHGNEKKRSPMPGDFIRLRLPGPGPSSGEGFDWVRIECIEDLSQPHGESEIFFMQVRPSNNPTNNRNEIAHIFSEEATNTFIIERNGNSVSASVLGRNEMPNTHSKNVTGKIRNVAVATGSALGLSYAKWKQLVVAIINGKGDD